MVYTVAGTPGKNGSAGDGGPALTATLNGPGAVLYDPATGNLLVSEVNSGRIRIILPDGTILTDTTLPLLGRAWDMAFSSNGTLLLAISSGHVVATPGNATALRFLVGKNGTLGATGDNGTASAALLNSPFGVTADWIKPHRFWIADSLNHRIRRVDAGNITTYAGTLTGYGGDGGPATAAKLNNCSGVAVDYFGNVFIADTGEAGGWEGWGAGRLGCCMFPVPTNLVDAAGNHRIRRVDAVSRIITTVAGNGTAGFRWVF
jgi:DNA-binding beta-propeller fold protein YncE